MRYTTATKDELITWINNGWIQVKESEDGDIAVFKLQTVDPSKSIIPAWIELTQRITKRNRSDRGSYRVDIHYNCKKASVYVSHLMWMTHTNQLIPQGWEVHHINEDPTDDRWENLLLVHPLDHLKLHKKPLTDDIPF